jgi:hypothetical protein
VLAAQEIQAGDPDVLAAREIQAGGPDGPLAAVTAQADLLAFHRVPVCAPLARAGSVLLTPWVSGPSLAGRLLATPAATTELLSGVCAELDGLHTDPAVPLRQAAFRPVPAVLARAQRRHRPTCRASCLPVRLTGRRQGRAAGLAARRVKEPAARANGRGQGLTVGPLQEDRRRCASAAKISSATR